MFKNKFKLVFLRLLCAIVCMLSFVCVVLNPISLKSTPKTLCSTTQAYELPKFADILKTLFGRNREIDVDAKKEKVMVYVGGYPLGFTMSCSGVLVIAKSNESAKNVKEGDIITHINNEKVYNAEQILMMLNSIELAGKKLTLKLLRNGTEQTSQITPIYDTSLKLYKLGLWIRDDAAGVGTLTYIRADNNRFGALGHPVCDIDTGSLMPTKEGNIFKCNIVGYKQGLRGNPGELKGLFLRNGKMLGSLDKNNKFGVFGRFSQTQIPAFNSKLMEVARPKEIKTGKAKIRCTIDGTQPKEYDIEIVRAYFSNKKDNKSMFIRITDKELIEKTGGIVQGMSGSPIIQNGKLVGAVTHVFVSDPTKGYAVFADYMIDN